MSAFGDNQSDGDLRFATVADLNRMTHLVRQHGDRRTVESWAAIMCHLIGMPFEVAPHPADQNDGGDDIGNDIEAETPSDHAANKGRTIN